MYSELTNVVTTNAAEAAARSYCNEWIGLDIAIKAIGMLLSMTIFSQAMMWVVLFYRCYHRRQLKKHATNVSERRQTLSTV